VTGSVVDKFFKTRKVYRPTYVYYDVIESWRILAMEPLSPDFKNGGKIPEGGDFWAKSGGVGNDLYVRNRLARRFGRCFKKPTNTE
jgi:hypothetical protein